MATTTPTTPTTPDEVKAAAERLRAIMDLLRHKLQKGAIH